MKYGGFKFLEAAHVKDVLAHLRVVENPLDAVSWTRLLCLVPGIGPRRRAALLRAFGGLGGVEAAGVEELMQVGGIHRDLAERIYAALHG